MSNDGDDERDVIIQQTKEDFEALLAHAKRLEKQVRDQARCILMLQASREETVKAACNAGHIPSPMRIAAIQHADSTQKRTNEDVERAETKIRTQFGAATNVLLEDATIKWYTQQICGLPTYFSEFISRNLPGEVVQGTRVASRAPMVEYFRTRIAGIGVVNRAVRIFRAFELALDGGRIQPEHLRTLFHSWVKESQHSDLQRMTDHVRNHYVDWIATNVFRTVDKGLTMGISYRELVSSKLPDRLYNAELHTHPDKCDWFSIEIFDLLYTSTRQLRNGEDTLDAVQSLDNIFGEFRIAVSPERYPVIVRQLRRMKLDDTPAGADRLHLYQYFHCYQQCRHVHYAHALPFWFRVMDTDDDGKLGQYDVYEQYAEKQRTLRAKGQFRRRQALHDKATAWRIVCDAVLDPEGPRPFTMLDVTRRPGSQQVLYDMLFNLKETKTNCNFLN